MIDVLHESADTGTDTRKIALRRKVCLVGAPGVGKTSLVRRRVDSVFSHVTQATIGVRVDKSIAHVPAGSLTYLLWDLRGDEIDRPVEFAYLEGMAAYFLVVDGCRPETLELAALSVDRIEASFGPLPFIMLVNKADRLDRWQLPAVVDGSLESRAYEVMASSAKTGRGVDEAFETLAAKLLADHARDNPTEPAARRTMEPS